MGRKPKSIDEYLPKKEENIAFIQAKVKKELRDTVRKLAKIDGVTLQDLIIASLQRYVDERKGS